jgi:hypothetical protein
MDGMAKARTCHGLLLLMIISIITGYLLLIETVGNGDAGFFFFRCGTVPWRTKRGAAECAVLTLIDEETWIQVHSTPRRDKLDPFATWEYKYCLERHWSYPVSWWLIKAVVVFDYVNKKWLGITVL